MEKGSIKKSIAFVLAVCFCLCFSFGIFAGCTPIDEGEQIDPNRTQLFVFNYDAGFGVDWLKEAKKRYEKEHELDVYEEGKQGVQIYITNKKETVNDLINSILENREEIYFTENVPYYTLKNAGILADLTEIVNDDLSEFGSGNQSVYSRLTDSQRNYLEIEEDGETHYYGIPHYAAYYGIVYNVDLFDTKGYYIADDKTLYEEEGVLDDLFISKYNTVKSAGPDGKKNTPDDGLPATYDEFFKLCDFIAQDNNTPFTWMGKTYEDYLNSFMNALVTDYEGVDSMMLNYNLSGQAKTLGTVVNGQFVLDSQPTPITGNNGYELARQQGKYEALKFLQKLVTTERYTSSLAFNDGYSHLDAQDDFLNAGNDGVTKPIAMLIDGVWWQQEATSTFNSMVDMKGEEYSKENRNFAFMPLPKANENKVNESATADKPYTLYDAQYSMAFMKSNVAQWKLPLAYDFLKFVYTQESLVEFTQVTNTTKALKYTLTDAQKKELSPFGESIITLQEKSNIVYPYSKNAVFLNNESAFRAGTMYDISATSDLPARAFKESGTSVSTWFESMADYRKVRWQTEMTIPA